MVMPVGEGIGVYQIRNWLAAIRRDKTGGDATGVFEQVSGGDDWRTKGSVIIGRCRR